ncbi:Basic helix-loop-helix transcription factor [Parasponia andersonii]|uniref:Basic helix-loop-helix transcription factor n=1 Tax=Parasponia andersonii TaxID=3476 RepID=A0A2P5BLK3_PARAD|nr:Basic helix-loop-helix transcription factor [Parasponia andersonii]
MDQGSQSSVTKIERRIVEKNRRNQMKVLYSKLNSLLPPQISKEAPTLPDQIDGAIKYIKSLETKVKKSKDKKKSLLGGTKKRSYSSTFSDNMIMATGSLRSPKIEIHEMGSVLEIVLITGQDNQFIFYEVIRMLHEERADVVDAKFSVLGDSIFHVVHAEIADSMFAFGATKISERLKRFVSGSSSDAELQADDDQHWWDDFEIHPEMLEF